MSDFKAKMHKIRFRLGLYHRPRWGSLQRSTRPLAGFKWPTSKGREGGEGRGMEGRGEGREGLGPPGDPNPATPLPRRKSLSSRNGSSSTNLQVLVLVLGPQILFLGSQSPRKLSRTDPHSANSLLWNMNDHMKSINSVTAIAHEVTVKNDLPTDIRYYTMGCSGNVEASRGLLREIWCDAISNLEPVAVHANNVCLRLYASCVASCWNNVYTA